MLRTKIAKAELMFRDMQLHRFADLEPESRSHLGSRMNSALHWCCWPRLPQLLNSTLGLCCMLEVEVKLLEESLACPGTWMAYES